jgi:hypothetical protein
MNAKRVNRAANYIVLWGTIFHPLGLIAATPASMPTTQNEITDADVKRLDALGNQLEANEAAIAAINKAIVLAGSKANGASGKAVNAAKGIELMDRKGGGPVRWQDFYGRTARSFLVHDAWGYSSVPRPTQFNYIYRANQQQIDAARAEIDSIGRRVDMLLDRRKQLESKQSWLWARLALESVQNRGIPYQRLYNDQLVANPSKANDNQPEPPQVKALRAGVRYLRITDKAVAVLVKLSDPEQGVAYTTLRDTLEKALEPLQESTAAFIGAKDVSEAQSNQMNGVRKQAGLLQSRCRDICDAYRNALEDEKEEALYADKQVQRVSLQKSLFAFMEETAQLDEGLASLANAWDVHVQTGVKTKDALSEIVISVLPGGKEAAVSPRAEAVTAEQEGEWVNLFNGKDTAGWRQAGGGSFSPNGDALVSHGGPGLLWNEKEFGNFVLELDWRTNDRSANSGVFVRFPDPGGDHRVAVTAGHEVQIGETDPKYQTGAIYGFKNPAKNASKPAGEWNHFKITVVGRHYSVELNGVPVNEYDSPDRPLRGHIGLQNHLPADPTAASFKNIRVKELGQAGRTSARDAAPDAAPAQKNRSIDLLKLLDPATDAVSGNWTLEEGKLTCTPSPAARVELPYVPPEEYDFEVVLQRGATGNHLGMLCVVEGHRFGWFVGAIKNTTCGFALVDGKKLDRNVTTKVVDQWFVTGQTHTAIVKVRKDHVEGYFDGKLVSSYQTNYGDMSLPPGSKLRRNDTLAIGADYCTVTIQSIQVMEITGKGRTLR